VESLTKSEKDEVVSFAKSGHYKSTEVVEYFLVNKKEIGEKLNICTVQRWIQGKKRVIQQAPLRKRGRKPKVDEELKGKIVENIISKVNEGAPMSTTIATQIANSTIAKVHPKALRTEAPLDADMQVQKMISYIAALVSEYGIPLELCLNFDQTGLQLLSTGHYTYQNKGVKAVTVIGANDKRQITATPVSVASGGFAGVQLIFQGETNATLQNLKPTPFVDLAYSKNH